MLQYAIVGTNWLCRNYRDAIALAGDRLTAVVSRDPARAAVLSGQARAFDSVETLLAAPGIDAVYVCLPNALHAEAVRKCLRAGKHVLCEKPLTATPEEAQSLFAEADRAGTVLAEAVMSAYSPAMPLLRARLAGETVVSARLDYSQRSSKLALIRAGGMASSFSRPLRGGALYDLGVYPLHFAVQLFGAPESVSASARWLGDVDVTDTLLLRYADFDAVVTASKAAQSRVGSEILCDGATYTFSNVSVVRDALRVTPEGAEAIDCGDAAIPRAGEPDSVAVRVVRGFSRWVRGEDPAGLAHLRQCSLTVQSIMGEARRQIGY